MSTPPPPPGHAAGTQESLWDSEPSLSEVTFCVVDLETSGTSPAHAEITEFGAVKVRGGEVLGEFSSFVRITPPLPSAIVRLTGITDDDLVPAPPIGEVLAAFFEFARGSVLVAHNARFDVSFLREAADRCGFTWDFPAALCTVQLARRILPKGETPSYRLGDLAAYFRAETTPNHRALADARATVDVLHGLIARVGNCQVGTLSELRAYDGRLSRATRNKAELADALPAAPGVYIFRDSRGNPLYVGSSINLHARARSYFSGGDSRGRMRTMVGLVSAIEHIVTANDLEAWMREDQLIDALQPPFNRRSRAPRRGWWLGPGRRVERTAFEHSLGPFPTQGDARAAADLYNCVTDQQWQHLLDGTHMQAIWEAIDTIEHLAEAGKFEHAARRRDDIAPAIAVLARHHALAPLAQCAQIVLAQRLRSTWTFSVIRYGHLAAAGTLPRGGDHTHFLAQLVGQASHITAEPGPFCGATAAQVAHIARWMDTRPTRIVSVDGQWAEPVGGAQQLAEWSRKAAIAARAGRRARRACGA